MFLCFFGKSSLQSVSMFFFFGFFSVAKLKMVLFTVWSKPFSQSYFSLVWYLTQSKMGIKHQLFSISNQASILPLRTEVKVGSRDFTLFRLSIYVGYDDVGSGYVDFFEFGLYDSAFGLTVAHIGLLRLIWYYRGEPWTNSPAFLELTKSWLKITEAQKT